jgi:hypothetical protein
MTASYAVYTRDLDKAAVERIRDAHYAVELDDGLAFDGVWTFEELYVVLRADEHAGRLG